ncbi:MAG: hypothetical protein CMJ36_04130 [Phycisphaerae bacterium]|nr:hypothetical protein [Phycisphaerae bacterium]
MLLRALLITLLFLSPGVMAVQDGEQPKPEESERLPGGFRGGVEWPTRIAMRTALIRGAFPISSQVVLVPDAATYLDELAKWTKENRWPVLLEDDFYAPMFIRAYQPEVIYRRDSVGNLPAEHEDRKAMIEEVIARAWRLDASEATTSTEAFSERKFIPVGVVLTSTHDPGWTAAVALAAAHGQYIRWLDGDWGELNETLDATRTLELVKETNRLVASTGQTWDSIGDGIEFVTICRTLPARCHFNAGQLPEGMPSQILEGTRAMTDCIGRMTDGSRWGFAGMIPGGQRASIFAAMSSYFLPRTKVWLANTYPDEDQWAAYRLDETARLDAGFQFTVENLEMLSLPELRAVSATGITTDLAMMTSKGNADFFDLGSDRASPFEVPVLNTPTALYLLHSWSMKTPGDQQSVGGRWMRNGAYAMVGSSHEPLLRGFVPPTVVTTRLLAGIPLGAAVRYWPGEGPFSIPWRINVFGDPILRGAPPARMLRQIGPIGDGAGMTDIAEAAVKAAERAIETPGDEAYAEAIRLQVLMGSDLVAVDLWNRAAGDGADGPASARAALGSLFREGKAMGFAAAFERLDRRTSMDRDMLWSLLGDRLTQPGDPVFVDLLDQNIRTAFPSGDMQRLAPALQRVHGTAHVRQRIGELKGGASNRREQKALDELSERYR